MEKVNYRIGLGLGITSVGWAAILTDSRGEPQHIDCIRYLGYHTIPNDDREL